MFTLSNYYYYIIKIIISLVLLYHSLYVNFISIYFRELIWKLKMAEYKKMKNENPDLNLMPPAPSPLHSTETADDVKNVCLLYVNFLFV